MKRAGSTAVPSFKSLFCQIDVHSEIKTSMLPVGAMQFLCRCWSPAILPDGTALDYLIPAGVLHSFPTKTPGTNDALILPA